MRSLLSGFDYHDINLLAERAAKAREIVYRAMGGSGLRDQITDAYRVLERDGGKNFAVAVRSSATAEDLPAASFAGQHESFLNVHGEAALFEACRCCFASIFTDRAIVSSWSGPALRTLTKFCGHEPRSFAPIQV